MKKYTILQNPIKEALYQGKRWFVGAVATLSALLTLGVVCFCVEMPVCGIIATTAFVLATGFMAYHFGVDTIWVDDEE